MFRKRSTRRRIRQLTYRLPRLHFWYRLCKLYTDNYNGINNSDMLINGELRFLQSVIDPHSSLIFDIGAHRGQWTEAILSILPNAQVHLFEPAPAAFEKLRRKNFPSTVILNQLGVGAEMGTLPMYIYGESSELNSLYENTNMTATGTEEIQIITVDEYCEKNDLDKIAFVKIDVEGHDMAVLRGARNMLQQGRIRILQFEYGANWIVARNYLKDVFDFVDGLPYRIFRIMPFGLMNIAKYTYDLDDFEHANYVLIHHDFDLPASLKQIT